MDSLDCPQCDQKFKRKFNLNRHMMVHKRPKLSCPDCEMVFYNDEQLERHKSSHTWKKVRIGVVSGQ